MKECGSPRGLLVHEATLAFFEMDKRDIGMIVTFLRTYTNFESSESQIQFMSGRSRQSFGCLSTVHIPSTEKWGRLSNPFHREIQSIGHDFRILEPVTFSSRLGISATNHRRLFAFVENSRFVMVSL